MSATCVFDTRQQERFGQPYHSARQVSWNNNAIIKVTPARTVLRPRRSPLLFCRHPKDLGNESSQRASSRVRSFRKDRGLPGVASRDPPLLSALPHRHPSATSCWLAAGSRPTIRKGELAGRRLKFPYPTQNDRICDGAMRSRSSYARDSLYKVAMSCSNLRSTRKFELHLC